jgi:hypothetical protein
MDDNDILYYLINLYPLMGMAYGAKHGITRLFFAAKREYFKNRTESTIRVFTNFVYDVIINYSITSGDVDILDDCLSYKHTDFHVCFTLALRVATINNRLSMIEYCMSKGADVLESNALQYASKYGHVDLIVCFIQVLRNLNIDENKYQTCIERSIFISIVNDKYEVFKLLLSHYDSSSIDMVLWYSTTYDRLLFVDLVLSNYTLCNDDYGELLNTSLRNNNIDIFIRLLNNFQYSYDILMNTFTNVVQSIVTAASYDDYHLIIDLLLERIDTVVNF